MHQVKPPAQAWLRVICMYRESAGTGRSASTRPAAHVQTWEPTTGAELELIVTFVKEAFDTLSPLKLAT